ncbi:hypothetical protein LEP1GSC071_1897 [Leptospira santarosai str. JET]|nr:hypothetical protein LEP1GSC071_1897 [Leptospira santarosai str. JET]
MKRKSSHKLRLFDHLWPWGTFKRSGSLQFQVLRRALRSVIDSLLYLKRFQILYRKILR